MIRCSKIHVHWPGKLVPFQLHQLFIYLSNFRQSIRWASRKWKCQFAKWFCRLYKSFGVHTNGVHACVQLIRSDFSQFSIRSHVLFIHLLIEQRPFDIFELLLCGRIGSKWKISNVLLTKILFFRSSPKHLAHAFWTLAKHDGYKPMVPFETCTDFITWLHFVFSINNSLFIFDPFQVKKK